MNSRNTIIHLSIKLFGYGIGFEFFKTNYKNNNDGSIKRFSIRNSVHRHADMYICFAYFWDYNFLFRLHLNRG